MHNEKITLTVISSSNGMIGLSDAINVLRDGGSAVDAVEIGIRKVESNAEDHSVGYGGYPNILGDVELDAAVMEGKYLASGAVGAMKNYVHPISVARKVMDVLPHVFLVGEGAERFASEMGFSPCDLMTSESQAAWESRLKTDIPLPLHPKHTLREIPDLWKWIEITTNPERVGGTTNFIALDHLGCLAVGVSTSGWAWKYPGRIGDSPVIGAGLYADNRYGAVACTGTGEMAIRACTAHSVVFYLKMGMTLEQAGKQAMLDLNDLGGRYLSGMNFIAIDKEGHHCGFSNRANTQYAYITESMDVPSQIDRTVVPIQQRWQKSHSNNAEDDNIKEVK